MPDNLAHSIKLQDAMGGSEKQEDTLQRSAGSHVLAWIKYGLKGVFTKQENIASLTKVGALLTFPMVRACLVYNGFEFRPKNFSSTGARSQNRQGGRP